MAFETISEIGYRDARSHEVFTSPGQSRRHRIAEPCARSDQEASDERLARIKTLKAVASDVAPDEGSHLDREERR